MDGEQELIYYDGIFNKNHNIDNIMKEFDIIRNYDIGIPLIIQD